MDKRISARSPVLNVVSLAATRWSATMNLAQQNVRERSGFKAVCSDCSSLSIRVADLANASTSDAIIHCGCCGAVRGTLADLHVLARRGNDVFEF
jgi:hypothetical protein